LSAHTVFVPKSTDQATPVSRTPFCVGSGELQNVSESHDAPGAAPVTIGHLLDDAPDALCVHNIDGEPFRVQYDGRDLLDQAGLSAIVECTLWDGVDDAVPWPPSAVCRRPPTAYSSTS
jgi:hypothetical protein